MAVIILYCLWCLRRETQTLELRNSLRRHCLILQNPKRFFNTEFLRFIKNKDIRVRQINIFSCTCGRNWDFSWWVLTHALMKRTESDIESVFGLGKTLPFFCDYWLKRPTLLRCFSNIEPWDENSDFLILKIIVFIFVVDCWTLILFSAPPPL